MPKAILLVDDSQTVITILRDIFEKEGYAVITANSGEEALEILKSKQPDVVIADTVMTGIDGFEVCRRIRGNASLQPPPKVIIMTGTIEAVDATKARSVGADDYCAKTSDFTHILSAVNELIQ